MLLGHVTLSLIIWGLFPSLDLFSLLLGTTVPNFDIWPTLLRRRSPKRVPYDEFHGASLLHAPLLYLLIFPVMAWFIGRTVALSFTLGAVLHLLTDSLDDRGRRLLYPFSKKFYGIPLLPYDFWSYVSDRKVLVFEALLFLIACLVVLF